MKHHIKRWTWRLVRLAVIAAALGYIIWKVDWQDQATLKAGNRKVPALAVEKDAQGVERRVLVEMTPPPSGLIDSVRDAIRDFTSKGPPPDAEQVWLDESKLERPRTKVQGQ